MFVIWIDLFKKHGGRFNHPPHMGALDYVWVDGYFEKVSKYNEFLEEYYKIPQGVHETTRSKYKTFKMRIKYHVNKFFKFIKRGN